MSEAATTYNAGDVAVRVDGCEQRTPAKVIMLLETAFAAEVGVGAWGRLEARFERGQLVHVEVSKTTRP